MAEKLDDLHQLFLGLVHAGHVVERHLHFALAVDLGPGLAEAHERLSRAACAHPFEHEAPDEHQHGEGKDPGEQKIPEPVAGDVAAVGDAACHARFLTRSGSSTRTTRESGFVFFALPFPIHLHALDMYPAR